MEPITQALSDSISSGNYKKALTFCDKRLDTDPNNSPVQHTKCLCYIQLGMYEEAAAYLKTLDADLKQKLLTETAYIQYKLRNHEEVLEIINNIENPSVALLHLKGQTHYRLGDHQKCKEIFNSIRQKEDSPELSVNIAAASCLANTLDEFMKNAKQSNQDSYELAFNLSCLLIQQNDLAGAEKQLILAEKIAREILPQQDFTEKEIEDELAGITVQLAYIYQLTGRESKAVELYETILKNKPSDASVAAVASNNVVTLHKDSKLFNAEKNLFNAISAAEEHKLTSEQENVINFNRAVVYLKMGKADKCREVIDTLKKEFPESPLSALIEASLLLKEKQVSEAKTLLEEHAERGNLTTKLALAQLLLKDGKSQECLDALQNLGDNSYRLGVVATCVKLLERLQNIEEANALLDKAVKYWQSQNDTDTLVKILFASGEFKFANNLFQEAAECFKTLINLDESNSQYYVSKLIIALTHFNPSAAASYAEKLPEAKYSQENIDVEQLENISAHRSNRETKEEPESTAVVAMKKKKKKKKKKRLPKHYDPNVAPDPERWLPRNQRSSYKKRKKNMRGRHQGMDSVATTASPKTDKNAQPEEKATAPSKQQPKKAAKKGKKKGRGLR